MPYLVKTLPQAERDLEAIYQYIGASASQAANAWFTRLSAAIDSLSEMPSRCSQAPEKAGTRQLLFGNKPNVYRIVFVIDDSCQHVNVLHVLHGAMLASPGVE